MQINESDQAIPISRFINILKLIVSDGNENEKQFNKELNSIGNENLRNQAHQVKKIIEELKEKGDEHGRMIIFLNNLIHLSSTGKIIDPVLFSSLNESSQQIGQQLIKMGNDSKLLKKNTEYQLGSPFLYQYILKIFQKQTQVRQDKLDKINNLLNYFKKLIEPQNPQIQLQFKDHLNQDQLNLVKQFVELISRRNNRFNNQKGQLQLIKRQKSQNQIQYQQKIEQFQKQLKRYQEKSKIILELNENIDQQLTKVKKVTTQGKNKMLDGQKQIYNLECENIQLIRELQQLKNEIKILKQPIQSKNTKLLDDINKLIKISDSNKEKLTFLSLEHKQVKAKLSQSLIQINKLKEENELKQGKIKSYNNSCISRDRDCELLKLQIVLQKSYQRQIQNQLLVIDNDHRQRTIQLTSALRKIKNEITQFKSQNNRGNRFNQGQSNQIIIVQKVQTIIQNVSEALKQVHDQSSSKTINQILNDDSRQ